MRIRPVSIGLCALGGLVVGCSTPGEKSRADSAQALVVRQDQLMHKLIAQRDSASGLLGDADAFIGKIDSSISRVKGLSPARASRNGEGVIEEQVRQRKDMLRRVDALVQRARETAKEVADLKDQQKKLMAENGELKDSLSAAAKQLVADAQQISELQGTIEQQAQQLAAFQTRLDDFDKQLTA